jgi:hypothetical protein
MLLTLEQRIMNGSEWTVNVRKIACSLVRWQDLLDSPLEVTLFLPRSTRLSSERLAISIRLLRQAILTSLMGLECAVDPNHTFTHQTHTFHSPTLAYS